MLHLDLPPTTPVYESSIHQPDSKQLEKVAQKGRNACRLMEKMVFEVDSARFHREGRSAEEHF